MTLEEMMMAEIDRIPIQKQSELQQNYAELYKEKEHYRYDAIYQEQRADKWQKAYEKLKRQNEELKKKIEEMK